MKKKDTQQIINIIQILIVIITLIAVFKIISIENYISFSFLSIISFTIAFVYFISIGYIKASPQNYNDHKSNYLRGIYITTIIAFTILLSISALFFSFIYTIDKWNDALAVLTLALTISTPYLTDLINNQL